jgi:hypothetical protein
LLVIAGYDANPIDGLEGKKTAAALDQFLKDRKLPADAANGAAFFQVLLDAVKEADGVGFSWCNETQHAVLAAIGVDEKGSVTTRGWYRVEAGKCVKPELPAKPGRLYSFAEAVDKEGQALKRGDRLLVWGRTGAALHRRRAVRDHRAEELRGPGAHRHRLRGDRLVRQAGRDGAVSGVGDLGHPSRRLPPLARRQTLRMRPVVVAGSRKTQDLMVRVRLREARANVSNHGHAH